MALPSEGQLYSLLGQTTSSEYKRRQQEERDFKRSLRRDQMKAMLLQPLIGAAATTGMEAIGDFLGDRFLKDGGKNFLDTEKGYALSNKLTGIRAQQKELQNEYDSLNKADAYQTMVDRLVKEKVAETQATGDEADTIKAHFNSPEQRANILQGISDTKDQLLSQLNILAKAPTNKELLSRLQNRKFYYGKGKISKLFSTGFNKLLGRDMEEIKARGLNYLLTGSEDEDRTTIIAEALKNPDNIELNQLALKSGNLLLLDDNFIVDSLRKIEEKNPNFYTALNLNISGREKQFIKDAKNFAIAFDSNLTPPNSFFSNYLESTEAIAARKNRDFDAFRRGMSKYLFRNYSDNEKGWINSQSNNKESTDKFDAIYEKLDDDEGDFTKTPSGKQSFVKKGIEETYNHSLTTMRSLLTDGDFRGALGNSSEEEIIAALNKFAFETKVEVIPDNDFIQIFVDTGSLEAEKRRFITTLVDIKDDQGYKKASVKASQQFKQRFTSLLQERGYDSIEDVANDNTNFLTSQGKRNFLDDIVKDTIVSFNTDKDLISYEIDAIGFQARQYQDDIFNRFPKERVLSALDAELKKDRERVTAGFNRKSQLIDDLTKDADFQKSLLIRNSLVRSGYNVNDPNVINAVGGRDKVLSLLAKPNTDTDPSIEEDVASVENQKDYVPNQTLGARLNNPLNVRDVAANTWKGLVGQAGDSGEKGYAEFENKNFGYRAADILLQKYSSNYDLNTIEGILNRFAPKNENPTSSYINFVAKELNVNSSQRLRMSSKRVRAELLSAMAKFESRATDTADDILAMIRTAELA